MSTTYDQLESIKKAAKTVLKDEISLNEAFHAKDRSAKDEMAKKARQHEDMASRHMPHLSIAKDKDRTSHELAILAHRYAGDHFNKMSWDLPQDYHHRADFYSELNDKISKDAMKRSKSCGVNCD